MSGTAKLIGEHRPLEDFYLEAIISSGLKQQADAWADRAQAAVVANTESVDDIYRWARWAASYALDWSGMREEQ